MWFDLLTFAVPQNLGSLEGTRILILKAFGYTAVMGMTYGFALRLSMVFWSCVGLVIYGLLLSEKKAAGEMQQAPTNPGNIQHSLMKTE
jgi:hypothetical protein